MTTYEILCAGGCGMVMGQLGVDDGDTAAGRKAMDHQKRHFCKACSAKLARPAPKQTPLQTISKDLAAISEKVDALGAVTPETQILKDLVELVGKLRNIAGNVVPPPEVLPGPSPVSITPVTPA